MKKHIIFSLSIVIALSLTLSGCGIFSVFKNVKNIKDEAEANQVEEVTQAEETTQTEEVTQDTETTQPVEEKDSTEDVNNILSEGDLVLLSKGPLEYDVYSMTIPDCWDQRVYAKAGSDALIFYEAMSFDAEENMGFLFSLTKSDNQVPRYTGEVYLAYSDDYFYYLNYPTDVPFLFEIEGVVEDYSELSLAGDRLVESISINDDSVRYDVKDFVCPMSAVKPIPEEMFFDITGDDLKRAKNEIYARKGQMFDDYYMQNYFESCSWYTGDSSLNLQEKDFTEVEWNNIQLLSDKYYEWQQENPYPLYVYAVDNEIREILNEYQGEVSIRYEVTLDDEGYNAHFYIDDQEYNTREMGIELENPDESSFYITSINPYYGGKEIAILDYGFDDNNSASFFTIDDNGGFVYIGTVPGCPFENTATASCNGFSEPGRIKATARTYVLGSGSYYCPYWFNAADLTMEPDNYTDEYEMVPAPLKTTKKAITVNKVFADGTTEPFEIEAGTKVYFVSTNTKTTVTIKTEDGKEGVLEVTPDMSSNPDEYFDMNY